MGGNTYTLCESCQCEIRLSGDSLAKLPREKPRVVVWCVGAHALMHGEEKQSAARPEHTFTAYRTVLQKVSYCCVVREEKLRPGSGRG